MRKLLPEVTSNGEMTFPWKLHMMLEESEREGFEAIVSWQDNYAFKVHDQDRFEKLVMKRFFHQTQFKSFLRQLNIYGFTRLKTADNDKIASGSYTHSLLIRGNPDACKFMMRKKIKKSPVKHKQYRNRHYNSHHNKNVGSKSDPIFDNHERPIQDKSKIELKPDTDYMGSDSDPIFFDNHQPRHYGNKVELKRDTNYMLSNSDAIFDNHRPIQYENKVELKPNTNYKIQTPVYRNRSSCNIFNSYSEDTIADFNPLNPYDFHAVDDALGVFGHDNQMVENLLRVLA
eukprot:CAMPEP_0116080672 /NCGR_PEP_ID=MMETSP0327-20121206/1801_1 /TAXON_ID=44447 /ORGANISM="Pseudo-nitzschia delicatissima, Strain B596" /LENGTH=286 /DNA_ID=CAMNT_0003571381 /DNA_START=132 /DNA_END=992 /DNA_ORIENTATION=+